MIIVDARFGRYLPTGNCDHITNTSMDVTEKVRSLMNPHTGTINWTKNHAHRFFGDPMIRVRKTVKVRYQETKDGPILTKCFHESATSSRNVTIVLP